jgi:2-polyprenyl-3-methyl-5-hydroxy-6-metoxy-1,4-benzoquinol methylase
VVTSRRSRPAATQSDRRPRENRHETGSDLARVALQCLLCGSAKHRSVFNEDGIDILQCRDCRHVFSSFAADPHYDGFWGEEVAQGEQRYWNNARRRMYQEFARRFLVGGSGRLLDMGCGLGFFLKAISPYRNWKVQGCEISPAAVRYARETLGLRNVMRTALEDADLPRNSFDIVTLWDVLEHVPRPDPLLARCHSLLREGGLCFLRTPNIALHLPRARLLRLVLGMRPNVSYLQARHHLHHYSQASIRRLLERNGFSRVEFLHLRPVRNAGLRGGAKNVWFEGVRALSRVTGGRVNLDTLFVLARKHPARGDERLQA